MKCESMLFWIDGGYAIVMALKMKAIGRNGALQPMQGGPGDAMSRGFGVG